MRPLLRKELRENAGWAMLLFTGVSVALAIWAAGELPGGRVDESIASDEVLSILFLAAPLGALALGFLQVLPELQRDAWAFLVHRPVSTTRIFLAKAIAGTGLYLAALLVPFCALALWVASGAPERWVFHPYMLWPGAAIVLASAGFHGAAMLVGLRRARWLGTRLLPLALPAGTLALTLFWIVDVNELPSPALLLLIVASHAVTTVAAWGSFTTGGEARGQPAWARAALGLSLGVAALGILGSLLLTCVAAVSELRPPRRFLDRLAAGEAVKLERKDTSAVHHFTVLGGRGRERIAIGLFGPLGAADQWVHSTPDGVLFGYREEPVAWGRRSSRLVRLLGPDGFREPPAALARRFGRLAARRWREHDSLEAPPENLFRDAGSIVRANLNRRRDRAALVCEEGIYDIDFAREEVRLVLAAPDGERLRGASLEPAGDGMEIALATDRSVLFYSTREEVVGEATEVATGRRADITTYLPDREIARASIPASISRYSSFAVSRSSNTYVFQGKLEAAALSVTRRVEADASGRVLAEQSALEEGEDAALAGATLCVAATFTPPVVLLADELFMAGGGPGFVRAAAVKRPGWVLGLAAIFTLQALGCAAAAWAAARRHGFSPGGRRLWVILCALFGPAGLVALAGTRDWAPAPACAACGRRRAVSVERCPYCNAALDPPPRDGTEIIEEASCRELIGNEVRSIP